MLGTRSHVRATRHRRGFSLLELAIASAVLAVALAGLFGALLGGVSAETADRQLHLARDAAFSKLDEARTRDFDTLRTHYLSVPNFPVPGLPLPAGAPPEVGTDGWGAVSVDASTSQHIVTVRVTVRWASPGAERRYETSTVISR